MIDGDDNKPQTQFEAVEIYRELISEAKGEASKHENDVKKREEMKTFLKAAMNTDQIERVNLDELKKAINGENMISRIQYRR